MLIMVVEDERRVRGFISRGLSEEELSDWIVPRLGFDEWGEQVFDYGARRFTVRLDPGGRLHVRDGRGKRLAALPGPLKSDDAQKAAALQKRIDALWAAAKFDEAAKPAEELRALRQRVQGEKHWEAADVARQVETLRQAAGLGAAVRGRLRPPI